MDCGGRDLLAGSYLKYFGQSRYLYRGSTQSKSRSRGVFLAQKNGVSRLFCAAEAARIVVSSTHLCPSAWPSAKPMPLLVAWKTARESTQVCVSTLITQVPKL